MKLAFAPVALSFLLSGCGGLGSASSTSVAAEDTAPAEVATPATVRIAISPVVVEGAAAVCEAPVTVCDASSCPIRVVELDAHENWCAGAPRVEASAQIGSVTGLFASRDAVWIHTDRGEYTWSGRAWGLESRSDTARQLVFSGDVWRMPQQLILSECSPGQVQCRSGRRRKCAAPQPECRPTAQLLLATHGPGASAVAMPNPLFVAGQASGGGAEPTFEPLVAIAGTSPNDVWILSSARLFHWDGHQARAEALDAEDPIVQLLSDATGVYARSGSGRRFAVHASERVELPAQPGPFLGARVEAPEHPYVTLEHAQATGPDAFWAIGHVRAFGGRYDAAPAIVRYQDGAYLTFVGALAEHSWLRSDTSEIDALRPEVFHVLVDDETMPPRPFPFVEVRWQEPRGLVRLPSGELLVATPLGLFGLVDGTWTREMNGAFERVAARGALVAALGQDATVSLRESSGWCPAFHADGASSAGLVVAAERVWLGIAASQGQLVAVRGDRSVETFELRLHGQPVRVEQLLAARDDLFVFARGDDGSAVVASFDGETWTTTSLGAQPFGRVVASSSGQLDAGSARFDGACWTQTTRADVPLIELSEEQRPVFSLVGDSEAELTMRIE